MYVDGLLCFLDCCIIFIRYLLSIFPVAVEVPHPTHTHPSFIYAPPPSLFPRPDLLIVGSIWMLSYGSEFVSVLCLSFVLYPPSLSHYLHFGRYIRLWPVFVWSPL